VNVRMIVSDELGRMWKVAVMSCINVVLRNLPGGA
jgi:hypothetical protein